MLSYENNPKSLRKALLKAQEGPTQYSQGLTNKVVLTLCVYMCVKICIKCCFMALFYCLKYTAQDVYAAEFGFDIYLKCRLCGISLNHISRLLFSDFLLCTGNIFFQVADSQKGCQ